MKSLIAGGAIALAVAAGAFFWTGNAGGQGETALPTGAVNAQEAGEEAGQVDVSGIVEMTMGPEDADVTVVEYASFTCPHCATFHENQFKKLKADYIDTGKVHFIYRDVYFDRLGLWASMVARCGGRDRFFGISEMLYDQQRDWIGSGDDPVQIANNLRRIGKVAGLDEDKLESCLADIGKAQALVTWFEANAEADDITSTPTLIINGEQYSNMGYDELKAILDEELAG
ncbi:DsbA family protein [Roseovarius sp. SYSU LYC5161]|uniref:DsbA family protein n=1 Tax=Roseovarius halophilus (ex Wu et al. 2025) TaxID=3376060 RepID=UPI00399C29DD